VCYNYIEQYVGKLLLLDENKFVKSALAFIASIISVYTFKTLNFPLVVKLFPALPNNWCVESVPQVCLFSSLHGQFFRDRRGWLLYVIQWHKYVYFGIFGASKHDLVNKKDDERNRRNCTEHEITDKNVIVSVKFNLSLPLATTFHYLFCNRSSLVL
jgi:hypothetical protein